MWWISYRGEGKAGVENIGVFEDDGTPRKKHPLLLDPSQGALLHWLYEEAEVLERRVEVDERIDVVEDVRQVLIAHLPHLDPAPVPVAHLAQRRVVFRSAVPLVAHRFQQ